LKPIKNQETEQLNNNNQPVNYHGASALQPERGRVIDGHLAAGEPNAGGREGEGVAAFAAKHPAGAASVESL